MVRVLLLNVRFEIADLYFARLSAACPGSRNVAGELELGTAAHHLRCRFRLGPFDTDDECGNHPLCRLRTLSPHTCAHARCSMPRSERACLLLSAQYRLGRFLSGPCGPCQFSHKRYCESLSRD